MVGNLSIVKVFDEVNENFLNILEENDWFEGEALCFDSRLFYLLDENKINHTRR
jgi:hypothetical protein